MSLQLCGTAHPTIRDDFDIEMDVVVDKVFAEEAEEFAEP